MELTPLFNYLNKYVSLTVEEETVLTSKIRIRTYNKGQFVVQNGDICRYESFVLYGSLKTFTLTTKDRSIL